MPSVPNVRIARKIRTDAGALIRTEVLGSWFVGPVHGVPLSYVRRMLDDAREVEPELGWTLQARGTKRDWHDWPEGSVQ